MRRRLGHGELKEREGEKGAAPVDGGARCGENPKPPLHDFSLFAWCSLLLPSTFEQLRGRLPSWPFRLYFFLLHESRAASDQTDALARMKRKGTNSKGAQKGARNLGPRRKFSRATSEPRRFLFFLLSTTTALPLLRWFVCGIEPQWSVVKRLYLHSIAPSRPLRTCTPLWPCGSRSKRP